MAPTILPSERESEPEGADSSNAFGEREKQADSFDRAKKEALEAPGPGWKEWFLFHGAKTWVGLGFFIVDAWIIAYFFAPFDALGMGLGLAAAVYLELLGYRFLWYKFDPEAPRQIGKFHPTWLQPREVGLWTPEAALAREGKLPSGSSGPRREEFL